MAKDWSTSRVSFFLAGSFWKAETCSWSFLSLFRDKCVNALEHNIWTDCHLSKDVTTFNAVGRNNHVFDVKANSNTYSPSSHYNLLIYISYICMSADPCHSSTNLWVYQHQIYYFKWRLWLCVNTLRVKSCSYVSVSHVKQKEVSWAWSIYLLKPSVSQFWALVKTSV